MRHPHTLGEKLSQSRRAEERVKFRDHKASISATTVVLMGVAVAVFLFIRINHSPSSVVANDGMGPVEERARFWYLPLVEGEPSRPRLDTSLAGMRIGPDQPELRSCEYLGVPGRMTPLSLAEAAEAAPELALPPAYVPDGAIVEEAPLTGAGACGSRIGVVTAMYHFAPGSASSFGGTLHVSRQVGEHIVRLDVARDRAEVITVDGRDAVLVHPLSEDGFGDGHVIVPESWGISRVSGVGLSAAELIQVASSLYE